MRAIAATSVASLVLGLLTSCYNPDLSGAGGFSCRRGECPAGYRCSQTSMCVKEGQPSPDAGLPDGRAPAVEAGLRPDSGSPPANVPICSRGNDELVDIPGRVALGSLEFVRSTENLRAAISSGCRSTNDTTTGLCVLTRGLAGGWGKPTELPDAAYHSSVGLTSGCGADKTVVAFHSTQENKLKYAVLGVVNPNPAVLDNETGAGAFVNIIDRTSGSCPSAFWVTYQIRNASAPLRRAELRVDVGGGSNAAFMDAVSFAGAPAEPAAHIAQSWDGGGDQHLIHFVAGQSLYEVTANGAQASSWSLMVDPPINLGVVPADELGVAATGTMTAWTAEERGQLSVAFDSSWSGRGALESGTSRPSIASVHATSPDADREAIAYVKGGAAYLVSRDTGLRGMEWSRPLEISANAGAVVVRAVGFSSTQWTWEVVYRSGGGVRITTVLCRTP